MYAIEEVTKAAEDLFRSEIQSMFRQAEALKAQAEAIRARADELEDRAIEREHEEELRATISEEQRAELIKCVGIARVNCSPAVTNSIEAVINQPFNLDDARRARSFIQEFGPQL